MVQKTSMSRGPYPPSQEIPMEVFDPSPQVRRGGQARGKGTDNSRGPFGAGFEGRRGERGCMPGTKGRGVPARPQSLPVMSDGWVLRLELGCVFVEPGGVSRAACHPSLLVSPASGFLLLGYRLQWVENTGAGEGIRRLREAGERDQAKGATQSTLRGARRLWVERGWHWEMAEAVVRGRCQQAFGAANAGSSVWRRGQSPSRHPYQLHSYILDQLPSPNTHVISPYPSRNPPAQKTPPKFGKLGRCQLTILEGKKLCYLGEGSPWPPPLTLLLCFWIPPRKRNYL